MAERLRAEAADLEAKTVAIQEKVATHVHDASTGDTPDKILTGAHGGLASYELSRHGV